jgi:hypothetical protein
MSLALASTVGAQTRSSQGNVAQATTSVDLREIAQKAYTFAYPMVVMEVTRRATTGGRLTNRLVHAVVFPDDHFRQVIHPNADTLYSLAWLDLAQEPVLLHVPDTQGRYYLFQLIDAWTETIASPGKRTTGTGEGWFAFVGPGWKGNLPPEVKRIDCPTNMAWLMGRTQTNNASDYDFVHNLQKGYKLTMLSSYGKVPEPVSAEYRPVGPNSTVPPPVQVAQMSSTEFFQTFAQLLATNPAHAGDVAMMSAIAKLGIAPGKPFPAAPLTDAELKAIDDGARESASALAAFDASKMPKVKTGWTPPGDYGRYGTNYQLRAVVARYFLGALPAEDAVYESTLRDSAGQLLSGAHAYTIHFDKSGTPPVKAFWSLSVYDDQGYFAANTINRFAIGDRDPLKFNSDGSLDIYIQHDSPGTAKESNWLPTPAAGFNMVLRMYWPEEQVIKTLWIPPAVVQVAQTGASAGR